MKSGVVKTIEDNFHFHHANENGERSDNKYLFVFADDVNALLYFKAVKNGQYPWAVHDAFAITQQDATYPALLVVGFDLDLSFDRQFPPAYHGFERLRALVDRPIIWIPDRSGQVPARVIEQIIKTPDLRLVKE
ncbi:MAG: hypothetical protein ACK4VI_06400 [Alphaproteobacteria bacterium]